MTDGTQQQKPGAGGAPPGGQQQQQQSAQRPEWAPEAHWDAQAGGFKPEFGAHYQELANFHKTETERLASLPKDGKDYKLELKLPETVKVPDGIDLKIKEDDPRIGPVREFAAKHKLSPEAVNELVALDAIHQIQAHNAEMERVKAEDAKLGANVGPRKEAITNWAKALVDKREISAEERAEIDVLTATAAGVTFLEKLIAKINGSVPGQGGHQPQEKAAPATVEARWYAPQKG